MTRNCAAALRTIVKELDIFVSTSHIYLSNDIILTRYIIQHGVRMVANTMHTGRVTVYND